MFQINTKFNKFRIPLLLFAISIGGIFLYQYLTFIPSYSSATTIETPVYAEKHPNLSDISTMQEMTTEICNNTPEHYSKSLTDTRDSQSYQVTKLKGTVGCWMTQNMNNATGRMYSDLTYGGYYDWDNANNVCNFNNWELPSQAQYDTLLATYNIRSDSEGSSILQDSPLNFLYGGFSSGSLPTNTNVSGRYWSSTLYIGAYAYGLLFNDNNAYLYSNFLTSSANGSPIGLSARCVASGTATPAEPEVITPNPNVSVTVPNIITLDVSDSVDIATESNVVNTGNFTATVSSNKDYSISLNAAGDSTSLINYKDGNKVGEIPTIVNNTQPQVGISSWGIMLCNGIETSTCTNNYLPLPKKGATNSTFLNNGTKGTHQHLFQIGIGIGPELPSGTYSTSIQVTASQK